METRKVRVRFAPSPTGPLHIGGVRTALYNYLFAKKHDGDFILRIEDTDQTRFVPGAEEYIIESLKWCGIIPNEGVGFGDGPHAPYRQSERKSIYRQYADQLIQSGNAYYAFDSSQELEETRIRYEKAGGSFSYNAITRQEMKNSISLSEEEVKKRISSGEPYVIRIKIPGNEEVRLNDLIRGWVVVQSSQMDDKVLYKSDGMPTYHLANVVDDYLMKITQVIRGEEWLPSAPLHVLLYRFLGWENVMPQFAHLPLLLKPDGNGKLSKRDGDRLGFPVFPLQWIDPGTNEVSSGYREKGFLPEAFINMLALLGWHTSGNREIFSMNELAEEFSLDRASKSGAKFDPEKAKWFNQQYLRDKTNEELALLFRDDLIKKIETGFFNAEQSSVIHLTSHISPLSFFSAVCSLVKEKATFISEFWELSSYVFIPPSDYDQEVISKKWNDRARVFFENLLGNFKDQQQFSRTDIEQTIKQTSASLNMKPGEIMQLLRVLITGKASGVDLLGMMELIGKVEVVERLKKGLLRM